MRSVLLLASLILISLNSWAEKKVVYTATNALESRLYFLSENGEQSFYQYSYAAFKDILVQGNKLYVADAIAPRVYIIDPKTGENDVLIDDWSLSTFYGLASDGKYFYLKAHNLRRYDKNGDLVDVADLDDFVYGMAWDGKYLWIMNDEAILKKLDISEWPKIKVLSQMSAPSKNCRGLSFDGKSFWTAESINEERGKIFQLNADGKILKTLHQPTGTGWAAAVMDI